MQKQVPYPFDLHTASFHHPDARVHLERILTPHKGAILMLRDDLLHPYVSGNKWRKLDAIVSTWLAQHTTDVITCGGMHSAQLAAVAAAGASCGVRVHALVRGQRPDLLTGNIALTELFAHRTSYIPQETYADRETMCINYVKKHISKDNTDNTDNTDISILPEGSATPRALYGIIRLVDALKDSIDGAFERPIRLVFESGTGTTALGLALGIAYTKLPWTIDAVGLFTQEKRDDTTRFMQLLDAWNELHGDTLKPAPVRWVARPHNRRFGSSDAHTLQGCKRFAQETGVLLDPIYTWTAWEHIKTLDTKARANTLWIHMGGALGMFGALARWPQHIQHYT